MRPYISLLLLILGFSAQLQAQTIWYVDQSGSGDFTGIQQAIDSPTVVTGDQIVIRDGIYYETLSLSAKELILIGENGSAKAIVDGGTINGPLLTVETTISNLTVVQGLGFQNGLAQYGGGAYINGSPVIQDCVFRNCQASGAGGAVWAAGNSSSSIRILDSTFDSNTAGQEGGAIDALFGIYIEGCHFFGNTANSAGATYLGSNSGSPVTVINSAFSNNSSSYYGGAVVCGDATISDSTFTGNLAGREGGALFGSGSLDVSRSTFEGNGGLGPVTTKGGAVRWTSNGTVRFDQCTFLDNASDYGGAVFLNGSSHPYASDTEFYRCLFTENQSDLLGGALSINSNQDVEPIRLVHCTVTGNSSAYEGGGIDLGSYCTVTNTIVWGNFATTSDPEILDRGYSGDVTYSDIGGGWPGTGNIDADPLFADPVSGDFKLQPTSPCVDAGDPNSERDYDGSPADLGAYRLNPVDADTDDDGILDTDEVAIYGTNPAIFDTDGDQLSDGLELGFTSGTSDTNPLMFVPDSDPLTITNPLEPDSDFGGVPDGQEDHDHNGAVDPWDTDPNNGADESFVAYFSGIIPGGKVHIEVWGATPFETIIPAYSLKGPGPSPTGLGILVDLSRPITLMDPFLSDAEGRASVDRLPVPNSAPLGLPVWMQAVEVPLSNNLQPRASNPVLIPIGSI